MPVVECSDSGKPGYQWRPEEGPPGTCFTYDLDDENAKSSALRAAAREGAHIEADKRGLPKEAGS